MSKRLVVTVGNELMGDDAAGPLLASRLRAAPVDGWEVIDGGSAPENLIGRIRELAPERVLIIDAADMDLAPGQIRVIGAERVDDPFIMTTHTLPLSYLMQSLREFVPQVDLVGIQPQVVAFGYPLSPDVRQAVGQLYDDLKQDRLAWNSLETEG